MKTFQFQHRGLFLNLLLLIVCFGVVFAAPIEETGDEVTPTIVEKIVEEDGRGNYRFRYETSDGSTRQEVGQVKNSYLTVKGSFEFVGEDGETYVINYVADEKGFRPEGDHIPQV